MALALAFREMVCFSNGASCSLETCESTQELTQKPPIEYVQDLQAIGIWDVVKEERYGLGRQTSKDVR